MLWNNTILFIYFHTLLFYLIFCWKHLFFKLIKKQVLPKFNSWYSTTVLFHSIHPFICISSYTSHSMYLILQLKRNYIRFCVKEKIFQIIQIVFDRFQSEYFFSKNQSTFNDMVPLILNLIETSWDISIVSQTIF